MKLVIPTLIAAAALPSLHASDRDEYYNSLLAKAGATPNTVEKTSRDEYYASLLASMQNNNGPKPAVKSPAKLAEPSADAIYTAYPNQGPVFYRYAERNSSRRNYYLGRPRRASANSLAAN
jgi:hypothetical protein